VDYSIYMSEVSTYERIELGDTEKSFLFKIMSGHDSSFKITSYIKSRRQPMAYKSEHAIVKRLLQLNLIEEEGKFLGGATYYRFTTCGLFYIFSTMLSYPPTLLIKYQDNVILKTLIYPYLQIDTIRRSTARLYSTITQYLRECCEATLYALDDIKLTNVEEDRENYVKRLGFDLEWHAKALGFKVAVMYNESNLLLANPESAKDNAKVALYELENAMKTFLSKDNKFMELLQLVEKEFGDGYKEIMELKRNNENKR
jgi:hypothetical protein